MLMAVHMEACGCTYGDTYGDTCGDFSRTHSVSVRAITQLVPGTGSLSTSILHCGEGATSSRSRT